MNGPNTIEGQILAGKYRVERLLGQGGMGVVLAARHIQLEERVAIKLMLAEAAFSTEAVARFLREARAAARLESHHVARVSDVGTLEDGRPYMVMEYLDGCDLAQLLAKSGPLAVSDAIDHLLQACEALAEAHSLGIVHRDLKPSNLFLTRRRDRTPHVKVLDFGISKVAPAAGSADNAMTRTSALMGTPLYMSPEQMTSVRDVDGRSDIWSLGIILFELISGSPPFMGETLPQVCGLVLQREAPPLSSRRANVPPGLDAVVARCLAKHAEQRYQSVAELAVALREFAGRQGRASVEHILRLAGSDEPASSATPKTQLSMPQVAPIAPTQTVGAIAGISAIPGVGAISGAGAIPGTHADWANTRPPPPRKARSSAPLVAVVALVPLLGAGAWWALHARSEPSPRPESSGSLTAAATSPQPDTTASPSSVPAARLPEPEVAAPTLASATAPIIASATAPAIAEAPAQPPVSTPTHANMTKPHAPAQLPSKPAPTPAAVATAPAAPRPAAAAPTASAKPAATETKKNVMGGRL